MRRTHHLHQVSFKFYRQFTNTPDIFEQHFCSKDQHNRHKTTGVLRLCKRDAGHHVDCEDYSYLLGVNDGEMVLQSFSLEVAVCYIHEYAKYKK